MNKKVDELFIGIAETNAELKDVAKWLLRDYVFNNFGEMFNQYWLILNDKRRDRSVIYYASSEEKKHGRYEFYGALIYFPLVNLVHIYVRPEYRKQGIAQVLFDHLRRRKGLKQKVLCSWGTDDAGGQAFFKKNFVHIYESSIATTVLEEAGGDGAKAFALTNNRMKAELRKQLRAVLR